MKYKTVFLDFDDTLIDTQGYATKCLVSLYDDFEINKYFENIDTFLKHYHISVHELWTDYAKGIIDKETLLADRFQKPFSHLPKVSKKYLKALDIEFRKRIVEIEDIIDGAQELTDYLKNKGYKLVMLSNGFSEMQYDKMKNTGFDKTFDYIILSDTIGFNKPHPIIFEKALEIAKASPDDTVMIGDNYMADIEGAMLTNIDQIWYNPAKEKVAKQPTYEVDNLIDILKIL